MSNVKNFSKDAFVYGLGAGLKKFIGLLLLPFYTRALTPADYGLLDTLGTFAFFIAAFIGVGIDTASGYYFFEVKTEEEKGEILFTTFILRLLTIIPSLIMGVFSNEISAFLFGTTDYTWLVFISCLIIPVDFMVSEQSHMYRFFKKPWKYNLITLLKSVVSISFGITLVVILKFGVLGALLATLFSSLAVVIFSFFYFTRKKYKYSFNWDYAKKMIAFGYPLIWVAVAEWVYISSDRFFLLHYKDLTEIGYYSIGTTFSQPIGLINMAVQMTLGILFMEMYHKEHESKSNSKKFLSDTLKLYITVATLIAVLLSIFSTNLINFITTPEYVIGSLAVPLLSFSLILSQGQQFVAIGITMSKKTWHFSWLVSVAALLNIGLNFYFVPKWGFVGAGFTTVISYLAYFLGCYFVSQKYLKVNFNLIGIFIFMSVTFLIAWFVPFLELRASIQINIIYKILLLVLTIFLTLPLGLVDWRTVLNLKETVVNSLKKSLKN